MTRFLFLSIALLFLINPGNCQTKSIDTLVVLYNAQGYAIRSIDSADYFMFIMRPDSNDNRNNVKGFYKNGKIKFIGKDIPNGNSLRTASVLFDGEYVSYYQNGKRQSTATYRGGYKDGLEYFYYSNGTIYCCKKHLYSGNLTYSETLNWECYDAKGNMVCKDGNGQWITYDDSCKNIRLEGQVVKGKMEGEWKGGILTPVPIKYTYQYKGGKILSSNGYDQTGKSYPFNQEVEHANYRSGTITFLDVLRNNIKLPKDSTGRKMSIDTVHVSFVIEKDGHLDEFNVIGNVALQLKDAIFAGLLKCHDWTPERIFGVPFRTQIILPLNEISGYTSNSSRSTYRKEVFYKAKILKE
jgi:antitoxin component YwqK of YwqJK toxin-antitoxin module